MQNNAQVRKNQLAVSKRCEWSLQTWWMEPPNDVNGASKQALAASRCAT